MSDIPDSPREGETAVLAAEQPLHKYSEESIDFNDAFDVVPIEEAYEPTPPWNDVTKIEDFQYLEEGILKDDNSFYLPLKFELNPDLFSQEEMDTLKKRLVSLSGLH